MKPKRKAGFAGAHWLGVIAILLGECLGLFAGPLDNLGDLTHSRRNGIRRQSVPCSDLRQLEHVEKDNIQRLTDCAVGSLRLFGNVFPIIDRGVERQLAQVPMLLAALAQPERDDGGNGGNQAAEQDSKKRVTHMLVGVIIGQILGGAGCVAFILWWEKRPYRPWRPMTPNIMTERQDCR